MRKTNLIFAAVALSLAMLTASGTANSQPQQGTGQKKQSNRKNGDQVSGKVKKQKEVTVKGTTIKNKVVLLETADGKTIAVDLGPTEKLKDVDLAVDKDILAWGRIKRVGDRPVFFATRLEADNKSVKIDRQAFKQAKTPKEVTGTVMQEKEVTVRGSGEKNKVVMLKTEKGRNLIVDLGPSRNMTSVNKGEEITVTGKPVRMGQRLILLASDVTAGGKTQQIQRSQGAPGGSGKKSGAQQQRAGE